MISGIRNIRKEKNISFKEQIDLMVINNENVTDVFDPVIKKLGNISIYRAELVVNTVPEELSEESIYSAIPNLLITGPST